MKVLTEVVASVRAERESDLVRGFGLLLQQPKPDGLERTALLRGPNGAWRIQTLWCDSGALKRMRAASDVPAAPELFRQVDAEPSLTILEVQAERRDDEDRSSTAHLARAGDTGARGLRRVRVQARESKAARRDQAGVSPAFHALPLRPFE